MEGVNIDFYRVQLRRNTNLYCIQYGSELMVSIVEFAKVPVISVADDLNFIKQVRCRGEAVHDCIELNILLLSSEATWLVVHASILVDIHKAVVGNMALKISGNLP
jgi:hypothetical protein